MTEEQKRNLEINTLIREWSEGDKLSLTDDELEILHHYYATLSDALRHCPLSYRLMRSDCNYKLDQLSGFKASRAERRRDEKRTSPA